VTYRAIKAGTVGKVSGGTKLLSYYHRGTKEQCLPHAHHSTSCVVKGQGRVEHIIVPETQSVVYASGNEEIPKSRESKRERE